MAETREGGYYAVKKGTETVFVDANGKQVEQNESKQPDGGEAQTTYPYADLLAGGGFKDWSAVKNATDEEILGVDGIGPAKLKEIRAFEG